MKSAGPRPLVAILVLLVLILLQVLYLAEHADWVLSHPVKGAQWEALSNHGSEWPSDYLPGGYFTQNRDAMLLFVAGLALVLWSLKRLALLRFGAVMLLTVICLVAFFALAILYSEQRYYRGIEDRRHATVELMEIIRLPMTRVPKGYCHERIGLRLLSDSGSWLMHLKCDTTLAYAISQQPLGVGTHLQIETGRDAQGNRVLLSLEPLAGAQ